MRLARFFDYEAARNGATNTGVVVGLQALIAGENRFAVQQDNRLIGTLSYTF